MSEPHPKALTNVRTFWNARARRYDAHFDEESGDAHALRARMDATLRNVGSGPGHALDAGMGPGRLCEELGRRGWTVWGVDASASMVELARERLPNARERLVVGSIERLPFDDAMFDCVTATGVLEYADIPAALAELGRVLRPGGIGVVSYPHSRALYRAWKAWLYYPAVRFGRRLMGRRAAERPRGAGAITPATFVGLLEQSGLVCVRHELTSALPLVAPLDSLLPRVAARLARMVEGSRLASAVLATQVVYATRKPATTVR